MSIKIIDKFIQLMQPRREGSLIVLASRAQSWRAGSCNWIAFKDVCNPGIELPLSARVQFASMHLKMQEINPTWDPDGQ